jgi:hypothetical protein
MSKQKLSLVVLSAYSMLALAMTYPLILHPTSTVPSDIGDPLLNTWILAWNSQALLTNPTELFNANIFFPLTNTLAYSEHLFSTAILALPLQLIGAEPILAYNVSLLITFPLAGFGMYLLALRWTKRPGAAFVAGLVFAFAPYRFAAIAHLQLLTFQWLPFAILFLDMIVMGNPKAVPGRSSVSLRYYLAFTLFLLLQLLASWYLATFTFVLIGLYLMVSVLARRLSRHTFFRLVLALFIVAVLCLPFLVPYLALIDDFRRARPLAVALAFAALPADYGAAAPFNRLFGPFSETLRSRPGFTEENTLFVGFIAPMLAVATLLTAFLTVVRSGRRRSENTSNSDSRGMPQASPRNSIRIVISTSVALIAAITLTFAIPYAMMVYLIPATTIIRVPPRWILPALFALASLAAFGYVLLDSRISRFLARSEISKFNFITSNFLLLLVAILLLAEAFSAPIPLAKVENRSTLNPAYAWLARQEDDFTLIELPLHSAPAAEFPEVKRLYASTLGWWPLVNGYSGYTPPRQSELALRIATFPDASAISALQDLATLFPEQKSKLYLFIHPDEAPLDRTQWETSDRWQVERQPVVSPLGQFDGDFLYEILPPTSVPEPAQPVASFGPDQATHLLSAKLQVPASAYRIPISPSLTLYWQTTRSLPADYTVFIHLRAADGFIHSQADAPPVRNHYRTSRWQPHEVVQDIHPLPEADLGQIDHIAIGLYNPLTQERLPAYDPDGRRLADDAVIIRLP